MKNLAEQIIDMVPKAIEVLKKQREKNMQKGSPLSVDVEECDRVYAAIQALQQYRDELGCPGV